MFIAKYNSDGTLAWAKRASSTAGHFRGFGIGIDGSGTIYVAGWFQGTATLVLESLTRPSYRPQEATVCSLRNITAMER